MSESVSVIIPTYNRAHLIGAALDSVFTQTHAVSEVIVVDDGSTDDTAGVLAQYPQVRYIRQQNSGPSAARNAGLAAATGDLIAFQDSDDVWVPEKIAVQLAFLRAHPEIDVVFGLMANVADIAEPGAPEIRNNALYQQLQQCHGLISDMFSILLVDNIVPTPTVMLKRSLTARSGGFDPRLRIAEDFDLWLRLATMGARFGFIDQVLLKRRRHDGNLINERITRLSCRLNVLEALPGRYPDRMTPHRAALQRQLSALHYDLGSLYLKRGRFGPACDHFGRCERPQSSTMRFAIKHIAARLLRRLGPAPAAPGKN